MLVCRVGGCLERNACSAEPVEDVSSERLTFLALVPHPPLSHLPTPSPVCDSCEDSEPLGSQNATVARILSLWASSSSRVLRPTFKFYDAEWTCPPAAYYGVLAGFQLSQTPRTRQLRGFCFVGLFCGVFRSASWGVSWNASWGVSWGVSWSVSWGVSWGALSGVSWCVSWGVT